MNNHPTAEEINPFKDLDGNTAEKNFLGKTIEDATELFKANSLIYQEDLMWMGPKAFEYYLSSVLSYLNSLESVGDADFIACLNGTFNHRLKHDKIISPITLRKMAVIVSFVQENYLRFFTDSDYEKESEELAALAEELNKRKKQCYPFE